MNYLTDLVEGIRAKYMEYFEYPLKESSKPQHSRDFEHVHVREPHMDGTSVYEEIGRVYEEEALYGVQERGIEVIAWYAPFHVYRDWGIHIDLYRLLGLAYHVYKRLPQMVSRRAVLGHNDPLCHTCRVVLEVVLEHEYFHFLTEYVATMLETLYMRQVYLPYLRGAELTPLGYDLDEEAIANALGLASIRHRRELVSLLKSLFSRSPPGYRDYQMYLDNYGLLDVPKVRKFWSSRFLGGNPSDPPLPTPFEMPGRHLLSAIPIYGYPKSPRLLNNFCDPFIRIKLRIK